MTPNETLLIPTRPVRQFIGEDRFANSDLKSWDDVKPLYDELLNRPIQNADDLKRWLIDRSELESYLSENFAWRYIKMTCDTANEELINSLNFFISEIQPPMTAYGNDLDVKAIDSPYLSQLTDEGFAPVSPDHRSSVPVPPGYAPITTR